MLVVGAVVGGLVVTGVTGGGGGGGGGGAGCDLNATTANFSSQYAALAGGQTLCLASGNYAAFTGSNKSSMVTVRAADGATVNFAGADIPSTTRNLTIKGVNYTGQTTILPPSGTPMNMVMDGVTFANIDRCGGCDEGRLVIKNGGTNGVQHSNGVRIINSTFGPNGCSDGIQDSSNGTEIGPGNVFVGITQSCPDTVAHVDALQPYGESASDIHGNWFHDNDQSIQSPDGPNNNISIKNNVFQNNAAPTPCVHAGHYTGASIIEHNVCLQVGQTDADFRLYGGNEGVNSNGLTCRNNIGNCSNEGCTACTITTNQNANVTTFVNFLGASSRCDFKLAPASVGRNAATDGTDIGLNDCP